MQLKSSKNLPNFMIVHLINGLEVFQIILFVLLLIPFGDFFLALPFLLLLFLLTSLAPATGD